MELKIQFKADGSGLYSELKKNCGKFANFSENGAISVLRVRPDEIKRRRSILSGIVNRVKGRPGSAFFIDGKQVPAERIEAVLDAVNCEIENDKKTLSERECPKGEGWGCVKLNGIALNGQANPFFGKRMWYDYGRFDGGSWVIDKLTISEKLRDEVSEKGIEACSNFSYENLNRVVDNLPNKINPAQDSGWRYKYRNGPYGARQQDIVGVMPVSFNAGGGQSGNTGERENPNGSFNSGSNPFNMDDNPFSALFGSLGNFNLDDLGGLGDFSLGDLFGALGGDDLFGSGSDFGSAPSENSEAKQGRNNKRGRNRDIPNVSFDDIGGLDKIIRQVREVIELPVVAPEVLEHYKIKPHKGILLYGPPGCGKTLLAKAVANEINAHFIPISGPEVLNKYVGQSEENLRKVFKEAENKSPSIIYFDEFDSIANTRNDSLDPYNARVVNQILTLLDGLNERARICVIASTNRIDMIDEAIKRPGRFDYVLEVAKPNLEGCEQIFDIYVRNMPLDPNFDKEAFVNEHLLGCTGADIAFIATEAAYNSIRRTVDVDAILKGERPNIGSGNRINEEDFLKALKSLKEGRKRKGTQKPRKQTGNMPPVAKMN